MKKKSCGNRTPKQVVPEWLLSWVDIDPGVDFDLKTREAMQRQTCRLKDLLRAACVDFYEVQSGARAQFAHQNVVISDRRTSKTTALIQFVAERMMILPPPQRVGVVCPTLSIVRQFAEQYQILFPNGPAGIRNPLIATIDEVRQGRWDGWEVPEVYAEEMFLVPSRALLSIPNFVVGIGTLNGSAALRIDKW